MCRLAWYEGPEVALSALLYDAPHSLEAQAYRPREMVSGHVNVDGTGVAWWPMGRDEPLRYRTSTTPWGDPNLPELAPRLTGDRVLAAVRSATPGLPVGAGEVPPFLSGGVAFAHNGWVGGFRGPVGHRLLADLPPDVFEHVEALSDSAVVFAVLLGELHRDPSLGLLGATLAAIERVEAACAAQDEAATLNLLVSDGTTTVATRRSLDHDANSLHVGAGVARFPDARLVVSEPLDRGDGWEPVPPDTALVLHDGRVDEHRS